MKAIDQSVLRSIGGGCAPFPPDGCHALRHLPMNMSRIGFDRPGANNTFAASFAPAGLAALGGAASGGLAGAATGGLPGAVRGAVNGALHAAAGAATVQAAQAVNKH